MKRTITLAALASVALVPATAEARPSKVDAPGQAGGKSDEARAAAGRDRQPR